MFLSSCSFECFKKHKTAECVSNEQTESTKSGECTNPIKPKILQFTTDDTVDPEKLAQLGIYQLFHCKCKM